MSTIAKRAIVQGLVQGVSFRASTVREAARIGGLKGYVRNLSSGDVEIVVQGAPEQVETLLSWARRGPPAARVTDLSATPIPVETALGPFSVKLD